MINPHAPAQVRWGEHSMVEALRALLRAALADPLNQRFQLLCEHALPLQSPLLVYQQLVGEARSRVDACNHPEWDEHVRRRVSFESRPASLPTPLLQHWAACVLPSAGPMPPSIAIHTTAQWLGASAWAGTGCGTQRGQGKGTHRLGGACSVGDSEANPAC